MDVLATATVSGGVGYGNGDGDSGYGDGDGGAPGYGTVLEVLAMTIVIEVLATVMMSGGV